MHYDQNYKRLFSFRRMVEDLLRACVPGDVLAAADLGGLRKLSGEYVSDELLRRHGDAVWRLPLAGGGVFVLVLLEFQSDNDRWMALRVVIYTGLLYQELIRNRAPEVAAGRLPTVLPVVLYNGSEPWTAVRDVGELIAPAGGWLGPYQPAQRYYLLDVPRATADDLPRANLLWAVASLERSRSSADLLQAVEALQRWLRGPSTAELRRAFADWVRQMAERLAPAGTELPPVRTLEDARMTLVERVAEWPRQWLREGREQGVEQGVEQQRALLCRMAARRFGAEASARLAELLQPVAEPERLAEVGDLLVSCDVGTEFLARVERATLA